MIFNFLILGKRKGGESIWKKDFEDEILDTLKFDRRGVLGMAKKGPNTNNSQFFITYKECPHLNSTATIFGRYNIHNSLLTISLKFISIFLSRKNVSDKHKPVRVQNGKEMSQKFLEGKKSQ